MSKDMFAKGSVFEMGTGKSLLAKVLGLGVESCEGKDDGDEETTRSDEETTRSDEETTRSDEETTRSDEETTRSDEETTQSDKEIISQDKGHPKYSNVHELIEAINGVNGVEYTAWIWNESRGMFVLFWGQYGHWVRIPSERLDINPTDLELWGPIRKAAISKTTMDLPTDNVSSFEKLMLSLGAMAFPNSSAGRDEPHAFAVRPGDLDRSTQLDPETIVIAAYLIGNGPEVEELAREDLYHIDQRIVMMQPGNIQAPHIDGEDCGEDVTTRPQLQERIHTKCSKKSYRSRQHRANALRLITIGREIGRTQDAEGGEFLIRCPAFPGQPENLQTYRKPELQDGTMCDECSTLMFHPHVHHQVTRLTSGFRASFIRWFHSVAEYPMETTEMISHNAQVLNELGRFGVWGYGHSPATLTEIAGLLADGQFEKTNEQLCMRGMAQVEFKHGMSWSDGVPTDIW